MKVPKQSKEGQEMPEYLPVNGPVLKHDLQAFAEDVLKLVTSDQNWSANLVDDICIAAVDRGLLRKGVIR